MNCVICNKSLNGEGDVVTLREKGSEGINRASAEGFDSITTVPGEQVHQNYRREYCCPSSIKLACVADASYLTTVPPVICDIKQAKKSISEEIKQLVVVAPLLATQNNVSSLRLIVSLVASKLNLG